MSDLTPPLLSIAIEPKSRRDLERLAGALRKVTVGDPSLSAQIDVESGQILLKGLSERHLELAVDCLRDEFGIQVYVGRPQVEYRETITRAVEQDYTHKKQSGGAGQFARVKIRFEPLPAGSGFQFENAVGGDSVPPEYVPGVEKGVTAAKESGVIAGFPLIDFKASLIDGAYHDVDSNVISFDIASRACFREGIPKAGPKLLEPIMRVEVVTPEEYMGDIVGDLNSRRGQVYAMETRGNARVFNAVVPMANMFGYVDELRTLSEGQATYSMCFSHYDRVPPSTPDDAPFGGAMAMRA
jgi:elongation factor G